MRARQVYQLIRRKCIDCCGHDPSEVQRCDCSDCPLHAYRTPSGFDRSKKLLGGDTNKTKNGGSQHVMDKEHTE